MEQSRDEVRQQEGARCSCAAVKSMCDETHRYCFKRCCAVRCMMAVVILGSVFAAGFAIGEGRGYRHERMHARGEHGYQMMRYAPRGQFNSQQEIGGVQMMRSIPSTIGTGTIERGNTLPQ